MSLIMTHEEFLRLAAEGYNRIPLMAEAFADLETPLSLYLKLAHAQGDGKRTEVGHVERIRDGLRARAL